MSVWREGPIGATLSPTFMSTTLGILAVLASSAAPFQAPGVIRQHPIGPTTLVRQGAAAPLGRGLVGPSALTLQGAMSTAAAAGCVSPLPMGVYNLRVPVPNFGLDEFFMLGVPDPAIAGPGDRPLLVVFH